MTRKLANVPPVPSARSRSYLVSPVCVANVTLIDEFETACAVTPVTATGVPPPGLSPPGRPPFGSTGELVSALPPQAVSARTVSVARSARPEREQIGEMVVSIGLERV